MEILLPDGSGLIDSPYNLFFESHQDHVYVRIASEDETEGGHSYTKFVFYEVFKVYGYNKKAESIHDIDLVDDAGRELGVLCLACEQHQFHVAEMTEVRFIAYLLDRGEKGQVSLSSYHTFSLSYCFVKKECSQIYRDNYLNTAPIWGGFTHTKKPILKASSIDKIVAESDFIVPTDEHALKMSAVIFSTDGFDRFLKKYHLLELMYDYIYVLQLKTMESSLSNFREVMAGYSSKEIESLRMLMNEYVTDTSKVADSMLLISEYKSVAESIFQGSSKESNPLAKSDSWPNFWSMVDSGSLSYSDYSSLGGKGKFGNAKNPDEYKKLLLKVASYWIYRIRCSVAHTKIGEHIFKAADEKFVVDVGETLIDVLIEQIYSSQKLKDLVSRSDAIDSYLKKV